MKKLLALLFIVSTMLISCEQSGVNEPDNPKDAPSFTFTEGTEVNPTIGYVGGELTFSFISNCSWTVEENDDWINISPTSGNQGNHTLAISVAKNTTGEERLSKITILYGVDSHVVINLTQEANEVFETDSEGNYIVEADGGTVDVKVTTNLEYDVLIPDEASAWLSLADTRTVREETLTFTVEENETFDERTAKVILKGSDGEVLQSITFKQKGVEKIFDTDSDGNYIVEADGGTVAVKVTTNLEYDVIIPNEALAWISLAGTRAVREETLTLNVAKNEGSEERSATVNLCAKGGDILQTITIKQNKPTTISCANNEIIYTTKYGYPIELNTTDGFGGNIMSHNYANGYGRISFDNDVVSIPNKAFNGCTTLTTIVLPNSLSTIDSSAFSGCSSLTSITIPDGVTSIGDYAFYNCSSLTSVTIPDSVTTIGDHAFYDCTSLTSVTIGNSVTMIGDNAFYNCSSLTSVTIPDSVTTIGDYAFYRCTSLTSITIPDSVTTIGDYAFDGCTSLTSITIGNGVTEIGSYAFRGCTGELIVNCNIPSATYTYGGVFYGVDFTKVTIGNSVTTIGDYAFYDCTSLTSVTIGNSVTMIGDNAFYNCSSLTSVTIPDSVTTIGGSAFHACFLLKSITISNSITTIEDYTFGACCSLTSVTIPDSVTTIGDYAFYNCTSLTSVTIGNGVTSIGDNAFYNCTSLTSVTIPDSVTEIVNNPFLGCTNLKKFEGKFSADNGRCLIVNGVLNSFAMGCGDTEYTIPDSVTTIGNSAFEDCSGLTSVNIPDSVTMIGGSAFLKCSGLTSITIPDSVTSIGNYAFNGCTSLTSVTIGNGVTEIGSYAFRGCTGELIVNCNIPSAKYTNNRAFYEADFTKVTIGNSVTMIGDDAFYNCSSLTSVTIPDSVTSIGDDAFYNCTSLTSVTIGNGVTTIGDNAFKYCSSLTSVTIPDSVTTIGEWAFCDCTSLTSVTIPDSVTTIGHSAFNSCTALQEVYCKATTPPVGGVFMFDNNASGRKIYVPSASVSAYKSATYWSTYSSDIIGYDF